VPAAVAVALLLLPLVALLRRTPWERLGQLLGEEQVRQALWLSVRCASAATVLSVLLGVPLAWVLARSRLPGRRLLRGLVTVPLVLPPVVGGVALLLAFGRRGLLGPLLTDLGAVPVFTTWGVVLAETFVAMPFLVLTVEGALSSLPSEPEEVAGTLGAGPLRVFATVTLPAVLPALGAGAALSAARALGEFGATVTFAGSLPGRTQTVPVAIYVLLQDDPPAADALSAVLLLISVTLILALRGRLR
jgi:molybdate transport system permease protein